MGKKGRKGPGGFRAAADRDEPRMALTPDQYQVDLVHTGETSRSQDPSQSLGLADRGVYTQRSGTKRDPLAPACTLNAFPS